MIPRFTAIVTAWVLSCALNFERMLFTCPLTVSSLIESLSATSLFALPAAINRRTSISRMDKLLSAVWFAICDAISGGMRLRPALTVRMVSKSSFRR